MYFLPLQITYVDPISGQIIVQTDIGIGPNGIGKELLSNVLLRMDKQIERLEDKLSMAQAEIKKLTEEKE